MFMLLQNQAEQQKSNIINFQKNWRNQMALRHSQYLMSPIETVLRAPLIRDTSPLETPTQQNIKFFKSSLKVSISMLLEFVPNMINLYYLGNLCSLEVQSAYGVVLVLTFCLGFAFYQGLAAGMESFLASIKTDLSIVIYQRVLLLGTILMIPIFGILFLFKVAIFPYTLPQISALAGNMGLWLTCSVYFNAIYLISRSLQNSRQKFNQQLVSNIITIVIHIIVCQFVFKYLGWVVYGAIVTRTIADIVNFNIFFNISKIKQQVQFQHFSACSVSELKTIAKILIPKGLIILLEIVAYESFTFQAAGLQMRDISTHIIATNVHNFGYFIITGIAIVSYINVSSYIMDNEAKSKQYIKKGFITLMLVCGIYQICLYIYPWQNKMTDIPQVRQILTPLLPFQLLFFTLDAIQVYISSISRSMGKHGAAIKHFLISYFVLGQVTCTILLRYFPSLEIKAVWMSMILSVFTYDVWQLNTLLKATFKQARKLIEQQIQQQRLNDAMMLDEYIEGTKQTDIDWNKYNSM